MEQPRRVPRGDELHLLMRCYGYAFNRSGNVKRVSTDVARDDIADAKRLGWRPKQISKVPARAVLERSIAAMRSLDVDAVAQAFVAGVGGSAPRGRQTLISYAWALHLPAAIEAAKPELPDCGLRDPAEIDFAEQSMRLAWGVVWNELPQHYLSDLEAAAQEGLPAPTGDDWSRFPALIETVSSQPAAMTPGLLEKDIAKQKIIPRSDKYSRYGILQALAECGVMPNPHVTPSLDRHVPRAELHRASTNVKGSPRSDIVLPLAGWRGGLGIDRFRLTELFGPIAPSRRPEFSR